MCVQYWPAAKDKSEMYGDLEVKILHEEELANFHIRTIKLSKLSGSVSLNCVKTSLCLLPKVDVIIKGQDFESKGG